MKKTKDAGQGNVLFAPPVKKFVWRAPEPPSLEGINEIDFDTETNGLGWFMGDRPIGISIRIPSGKKFYLPWGHNGGNLAEDTVKRWALRELRGKKLYGANIKFDIHMMREWGVDLAEMGCTVGDVMHQAALLDDHRKRFNLEQLSQDYLGRGKVKGLDANHMADYHAADVHEYAEEDVELNYGLRTIFRPQLEAQNLMRVLALEEEVIFPVCEMEKNGAPIDMELLNLWLNESEQRLNRMHQQLAQEVGFVVDPCKPSGMERIFVKLQIPIVHWTDNGSPSFDDGVLKVIQHPTIKLARAIRKLTSLRNKFLIPYNGHATIEGILRYGLNQLRSDEGGTISGRFSSSSIRTQYGEFGCNVQQVASAEKQEHEKADYVIRRLFVAREGKWLAADAKQIEYRIFADRTGSPKILKAYEEDPETDFHQIVTDMAQQVRPDVTRKHIKNVNFAKVFGAGKNKIALMLELPRHESDVFVGAYDSAFPEVDVCIHEASSAASRDGYVTTILGRRSRFPRKERLHKALNAIVQGSAADLAKIKIVEVYKMRKQYGFVMRFPVHDELCGDSPTQECTDAIGKVLNSQSLPFKVPILWDVSTGANWAECA